MLNNINNVLLSLKRLGLSLDEAKVYINLLEKPMSHLELSRASGINRTKVYRIAEVLEKRSLIAVEVDDLGQKLFAADPVNLEIYLTSAEESLKAQREIYQTIVPDLKDLYKANGKQREDNFNVNSYDGVNGFKQMLWNELKAKDEILIFGHGTIQELVNSPRWAEKHRSKTLESGYIIREILNPGGKKANFTKNNTFIEKAYIKRYIDRDILPLSQQICIYNNTVAIYNWSNGQKVGAEVINSAFADMQRAIFESYWLLSK